jgi:hypothetical protein
MPWQGRAFWGVAGKGIAGKPAPTFDRVHPLECDQNVGATVFEDLFADNPFGHGFASNTA